MDISFDGSFLGDITDNVITHSVPGGTPANYLRFGKNDFKYIKIYVEKIGNTSYTLDSVGNKVSTAVWTDLMTDVLKGIFYLPSFGFHTGIIQSVSVSEDTEIVTKARYCIRPVYDEVLSLQSYMKLNKETDNDLIHRFKMFSELLLIKDPIIEMCKLSIGEKSFWIPTCRCKNGFIDLGPIEPSASLIEFIKPYRTPMLLKYKMETTLHTFFPEKKTEIDVWMNNILNFLEPQQVLCSNPSESQQTVKSETLEQVPTVQEPAFVGTAGPNGDKVREPVKNGNIKRSFGTSGSLPPIPELNMF